MTARMGRKQRPPQSKGKREPTVSRRAKLTWEDIYWIRYRRMAAGQTYEAIAADYPVSANTISDVCNFRSWVKA